MSPRTSASGKVAPTGVPLSVGHRVVVGGAEMLDAAAPLVLATLPAAEVIVVEVEVPELELGLARRADGREHDVPPTGRPADGVTRPCWKCACVVSSVKV